MDTFSSLINHYQFTCCIESIVDPDRLQKPADLVLHCLQRVDIWVHTVFKREICLSSERYKLICPLGQVKFSLDKYIMAIYLSLDKEKI